MFFREICGLDFRFLVSGVGFGIQISKFPLNFESLEVWPLSCQESGKNCIFEKATLAEFDTLVPIFLIFYFMYWIQGPKSHQFHHVNTVWTCGATVFPLETNLKADSSPVS